MKNENCKIEESKLKKFLLKSAFPLFGLGALIWFLVRVIPKPSRAGYPCMQVAAPMASSFVLWLLGLSATIISFKKTRDAFKKSSFSYIALFATFTITSLIFTLNQGSITSFALGTDGFDETVTPNNPIGEAQGINPGAVVWVWNSRSTNEYCKNKYFGEEGTSADASDDGWFLNKNNNQDVIDSMLSAGLKNITSESTDIAAWNALFTHFNQKRHSRTNGYTEGEKIFIKINATSTWGKGQSWGNITENNEHMRNDNYGMAETSPHLILALLRQLVNTYGVQQEDIAVGDPMKLLYNNSYDLWYNEFPNIHYVANEGGLGRVAAIPSDTKVLVYSDKGNKMPDAVSDKLYIRMNDADYLINVPTMKAHARAGVTLFAKNNFGSHTRGSAEHLHTGLVAPENAIPIRTDSSMYRVQVDLMGHEKIGGNQVLFLLDALWSGSEAVEPPTKWDMEPFNGDWTSSIFLSQDMVAIESVAFDFLYAEYDGSYNANYFQKVNYPHMTGTTDYLRQAASSEYWPQGFSYDPEGDGTPIVSLGVNEHWNNPTDKQYSRNLGGEDGVDLIFINQTITNIDEKEGGNIPTEFILNQNYPNPFNPTTTISYTLKQSASVKLEIFDISGSLITTLFSGEKNAGSHNIVWNGNDNKGEKVSSGMYVYHIQVKMGSIVKTASHKMLLLK